MAKTVMIEDNKNLRQVLKNTSDYIQFAPNNFVNTMIINGMIEDNESLRQV